jgi:hypothetical protein
MPVPWLIRPSALSTSSEWPNIARSCGTDRWNIADAARAAGEALYADEPAVAKADPPIPWAHEKVKICGNIFL